MFSSCSCFKQIYPNPRPSGLPPYVPTPKQMEKMAEGDSEELKKEFMKRVHVDYHRLAQHVSDRLRRFKFQGNYCMVFNWSNREGTSYDVFNESTGSVDVRMQAINLLCDQLNKDGYKATIDQIRDIIQVTISWKVEKIEKPIINY